MKTQFHEDMVEFIAKLDPLKVSNFHASEEASERVAELLAREKNEGLTAVETSELDAYLHLEHVMRLAKARAKQILTLKTV